tara:strand:- start:1442 stop:1633 length:192 start_codon:yes stop_codon:yes gene_type:complete
MSNDEITLRYLAEKLEHIHKDVEKNSLDIEGLKLNMSFGKGAVKTVFWIGSIVAILVGLTRLI